MSSFPSSYEVSQAIIPKVGGMLSLIACTLIMRDVITKWNLKRSVPLRDVLVFFISVADWFYSFFAAFMSTWMVQANPLMVMDDKVVAYPVYLARGNTQTCAAQGFIATLSLLTSVSYYTTMMILYWLIVHFGWRESRLNKPRLRFSFILPPIFISSLIAIPPLFLEMYNPGNFTCTICDYPYGCASTDNVDCERGEGALNYLTFSMGYIFLCNVIIVTFVSMLVFEIFKQERKTDRYLTPGQEMRRANTKKTTRQGLRYIGAYILAYFPFYYIIGSYAIGKIYLPSVVKYLLLIFTPLLGFFNAFVYFQPRYAAYKESNPDKKWLVCLSHVFNADSVTRRVSTVFSSGISFGDNPDSITRRVSRMFGSGISFGDTTNPSDTFRDNGGDRADHGDLSSIAFQESDCIDHNDRPSPLCQDSVNA